MSKRIVGFALSAMLFALCVNAKAQPPKKVPRIGYLGGSATANPHRLEAFRRGLRDLGYVEGKNIALELRFPEAISNASAHSLRNWCVSM